MSVENLKEYGKLCATDETVRAEAKEIGMDNIEGQIEHAKSLGLEFSTDDLMALAKQTQAQGELSEEDLEAVAGGVVSATAVALAAVAATSVGVGAGVATAVNGW